MTQKKKRHITHLSDSKQCFKSLMSLSGFPSLLAWSLTSRRNMEAVSVQCIWSMAMAFFLKAHFMTCKLNVLNIEDQNIKNMCRFTVP